jgi:hypothetical protein
MTVFYLHCHNVEQARGVSIVGKAEGVDLGSALLWS